ncbi:hypothetical protein GCM10010967_14480 [Dyadobacter beijingensis]|uniref:Uncharacterized protein n=1 Tax=Dyadobacter beijingensis TaxID=365489 RepID=A0ABQ2HLD2_9BACT|nr:hypothetical protein [Dyadobacter beijingensis]GGM83762.1 hypothetical protein GCM10010967_14480 [Dyadobacter beijingensis]
MDKEIHIRNLVYKYISNQCNGHEQDELLRHLQTPAGKWVFDEVMTSEAGKIFTNKEEIEPAVSNRLLGRLHKSMLPEDDTLQQPVPFYRNRNFILGAAGVVVLLIAFLLYRFLA